MTTTESGVVDGSDTGRGAPDYTTVDVPTTKPPEEFTYQERRADLLGQIRDLGHPSMLHQGEAAERYGVSQQQISKDLDRIAESCREHLTQSRDRRALQLDSVVQRSIRGLLGDEEWRAAARTAIQYQKFLQDWEDVEQLEGKVAGLREELEESETHLTDVMDPDK
jgi:hypothetical protein